MLVRMPNIWPPFIRHLCYSGYRISGHRLSGIDASPDTVYLATVNPKVLLFQMSDIRAKNPNRTGNEFYSRLDTDYKRRDIRSITNHHGRKVIKSEVRQRLSAKVMYDKHPSKSL